MEDIVVYCADVGSIPEDNFGWARMTDKNGQDGVAGGDDIETLLDLVVEDLNEGQKVTLGFECPLYIQVRDEPEELARQRKEEKGPSRAWSAGGGATILPTGIVQCLYLLRMLKKRLGRKDITTFLDPGGFNASDGPALLLWEAFVSGEDKPDEGVEHVRDAIAAVDAFFEEYRDDELTRTDERVHSLIGSALLRTGWTDDPGVLSEACPFVRPAPSG